MGCLMFLIVIAISCVITVLLGGLTIAIVGAWFLHTPFIVGWHAAFANPWKLAIWLIIVLPLLRLWNSE